MNNLVILHTIYKDINNKDLVNNHKESRRREAAKLEISFLKILKRSTQPVWIGKSGRETGRDLQI